MIDELELRKLIVEIGDRVDSPQPTPGITSQAVVTHIVDGDTLDVELRKTVRVRLLDCWAPESRTRNAEEKKRGLAAKDHLKRLVEPGDAVVVFIPASEAGDVSDVITMGRFLGRVYLPGVAADLSQLQRAAGHASATKGGPIVKTTGNE